MLKEWRVAASAPHDFVSSFASYHPLIAQLLYNRGLENQEAVDKFFSPDYTKLHDPFLFSDMRKAVDRIWKAIENKEKIFVHGDYDADGVTSAATIFRALDFLKADVTVFIPHRELDGYGLRVENCKKFADAGCNLLITVDCGVTNVQEAAFLKENNVDIIVTDHHEPLEVLPDAFALIDAKIATSGYPFRDLSGAGVAFKVVQALFSDEEKVQPYFVDSDFLNADGFKKWLLDIVAIGTVADVMPLIDENRILVKWGLIVLEKTKNIGLKKLLSQIGSKKVDSFTIGYQLAPRLNAAGRMNHARASFELLTTKDELEAERLAMELQKNNSDRQKVTELAVASAKAQIAELQNQNFLLAYDPTWQAGVIGLIAGKLCEEYCKPVIVMTESNGRVIGSGRSVEGFNITQSLVTVKQLLARFGGHCQACGFTLADLSLIAAFKSEIVKQNEIVLQGLNYAPFLEVDCEAELNALNFEILQSLNQFEPFGEGNEKPRFLLKNVQVTALDAIGSSSQHLRFSIKQNGPRIYKMLWFGKAGEWLRRINVGDTIEVVAELGINEWNGRSEIEVKVVDLKKN